MGRYGYRNVDGVKVTSGPAFESIANCSCWWGENEGHSFGIAGARALTARAKRHVAATGHKVTIIRSTAAIVEPDR